MEFRVVESLEDELLIADILETSARSHNIPMQSLDWYRWKYNHSPFGPALCVHALETGKIVGNVSFGRYPFYLEGRKISGFISYETYIHPNFRNQGLFSRLIDKAEVSLKEKGAQLLLNFPNSKSLRGFLGRAWVLNDSMEYWLKPMRKFKVARFVRDLALPFEVVRRNQSLKIDFSPVHFNSYTVGLKSFLDEAYYSWRFNGLNDTAYELIETEYGHIIGRYGHRGRLSEFQVLGLLPKKDNLPGLLHDAVRQMRMNGTDFLSMCISRPHPVRKALRNNFFFSVPHKINCTLKALDSNVMIHNRSIILEGVDFHTY